MSLRVFQKTRLMPHKIRLATAPRTLHAIMTTIALRLQAIKLTVNDLLRGLYVRVALRKSAIIRFCPPVIIMASAR